MATNGREPNLQGRRYPTRRHNIMPVKKKAAKKAAKKKKH
jgi:hypothetical protein